MDGRDEVFDGEIEMNGTRGLYIAALCGGIWALGAVFGAESFAFDYLEHSYFTDRACRHTQHLIAQTMASPAIKSLTSRDRDELQARYLALALYCPRHWKRPYCQEDYKQLEGSINALEEPPHESGEHSLTFGDVSALPDHISQFGPVRGFPRAVQEGLLYKAFDWITEPEGEADGIIADVAEDACETDGLTDWGAIETTLQTSLVQTRARGRFADVPAEYLTPQRRAEIPRGPHDPAGAYSFDNPHYLDLVLKNHHHFGDRAFYAWVGFHRAAQQVAQVPCSDSMAIDPDDLEDLAEEVLGLEDVDVDELAVVDQRLLGCAVLSESIRRRLALWERDAPKALTTPVQDALRTLRTRPQDPRGSALLKRVSAAWMALIFEGAGLHFLQDNVAGGHVRTNRGELNLEDSRIAHDEDGRMGVVVEMATREGRNRFVAFGDGYLLAPLLAPTEPCAWDRMHNPTPERVSACLLRTQRAVLTLTTSASLLDWVLSDGSEGDPCAKNTALHREVCRYLPMRPTTLAARSEGMQTPERLGFGELPTPPSAFSYQSLNLTAALDASGESLQQGVFLSLLSQLGDDSLWLTSYEAGLYQSFDGRRQYVTELGYIFHWRLSARGLLSAGSGVHMGLEGFGEEVAFFSGLTPKASFTILPEGWIRLPLEASISYRLPITFFSTDGVRIEAHWISLGLGLSFL